jgi:hypothetical protein
MFPQRQVLTPVALVRSGAGKRGKGYAQMRKDFRAMFNEQFRGERAATAVVRRCIEDDKAPWDVRLKAVELALKYGFGMPERMDDEQIIVLAERKLEERIAEARAALGAMPTAPIDAQVTE